MNEAGVFGRFVPDFGRVVAQMQFDMYHHYTVDEHSIRAIGLLAAIERGELKQDHPLSTAIFRQIASRRVLYVAVLLHDIAKGRGGDHSVIGAEIALEALPALRARRRRDRDGLVAGAPSPADVVDRVQARPRRPQDDRRFRPPGAKPRAASAAADPDRRRHPGGRPRHLERVEADAPSHPVRSRRGAASARPQAARPAELVQARQQGACGGAGMEGQRRRARMRGAFPTATGSPNRSRGRSPMPGRSRMPKRVSAMPSPASSPRRMPESGATRVSVFTPDREGLFYRICAGLAVGGREHHRRPHSHHARRQWRSTICWCSTAADSPTATAASARGWSSRSRRRWLPASRPPLPSAERCPARSERVRGRPVGRDRRARVDAEPPSSKSTRATGRRCSPRSPLRSTLRPHHPFGAYRDLWRARRRRLLSDDAQRSEARPGRDRGAPRARCSKPRASLREREPPSDRQGTVPHARDCPF